MKVPSTSYQTAEHYRGIDTICTSIYASMILYNIIFYDSVHLVNTQIKIFFSVHIMLLEFCRSILI